jgi:N-acetylglucosaminyldiphosphoundecaprenol N-acetyl-beta-D-mannosaminyltransferase
VSKDQLDSRTIGGVRFAVASPDEAVAILSNLAASRRGGAVHLVNAYKISLARKDRKYAALLDRGVYNFADGKPISWVSRLGTGRALTQVRGPSLFRSTLSAADPRVRDYLLGGTAEVLDALEDAISQFAPDAIVCGSYCPPFHTLTVEERHDQSIAIRESGANLLWVGLGTPKQDFEAEALAKDLGVVAVAVCAAFDFTAGTKRSAPQFARFLGLEWLFRLLSEPRRQWRRYLFGNLGFILAVIGRRE